MTYDKAIKTISYMLSKNPYNQDQIEALTLANSVLKKEDTLNTIKEHGRDS